MDERISIPVSLPHPNPTVSYWQNPPDEIGNICSTTKLPAEADIAIVGSGISGVAIAYDILHRAPKTQIVMLEARQAVSGATGRNGGHTKGASYTTFPSNVEKLGLDEAIKIAKLELNTVRQVHAFARKHNIDCESKHINTTDIIYNQETLVQAAATVKFMQKVMPNHPASKYTFWSKKDTEEKFLVPGAAGAITYEAGSLSSYKFVIGLLKLCLKQGLNLQTNTPVTSLHRQENSTGSGKSKNWTVVTPRGNIKASKVIMATNGYSAAIYPKLQGVIVPVRGQVTAQRPGSGMPASGLQTTYSFNYGSGFDYMIQCPDTSKYPRDIVIGGGFGESKNGGLSNYGNTDDSVLEPAISEYLAASAVEFFGKTWGRDNAAGRVRHEWTGIMGYSADGYPLVGEMPGEPGLFISASFQGHGMVLCLLCSRALTSMLFGDNEQSLYTWFPRAYKITSDRLKQRLDRGITPAPKSQSKARL
ncbi:hypothetical protein AJ78_08726 [Emergomyces pasteurianus Ep9510]|uniref:FAD dependent oxidoreductase domain-containing protein n=1 Tax=Emergomyces pasteurianus Ep9510 TaxID=1447872 RepID=A0A1J9Q2I1_9EURO|nr:hypothetical protein AJ78_08726 [Emergomyces pasteurianus Ep9510]